MTEIIYGNSTEYTMRKSNLSINKIININIPLSVANLNYIDNYEICLPITLEETNQSFKKKIEEIKNTNNIRIWCSHKEANSYLLMIYVCNLKKDDDSNINVVFSDDYINKYSPAIMLESELENAANNSINLSKEEIDSYANEWEKIKSINSEMRIFENDRIKNIRYNYFDNIILEMLKKLGAVKEEVIGIKMMEKYNISDNVAVFLINLLINQNKIKVLNKSPCREFDNIISLNN